MATAYFTDDRVEADARNELADQYEFVPNFYLSLPTAVRGSSVDSTRGHVPQARFPNESGISDAHARNLRGAGVLVGVLDTGVDADHAEMVDHSITYRYVSLNPSSPYWPPRDVRGFDPDGHGTHVCGIIAGKAIGVAPEARLYVASVIESETVRTSLLRVAYGLDWMMRMFSNPINEHLPAVINMSLGFPSTLTEDAGANERLTVVRRILKTLKQANVMPVVAVGNDGPNHFGYPAGFEEALGVGAVAYDGSVAPFSGSTPRGEAPAKPDIFGYGVDVYSSFERDYSGRSGYQTMSGTSMAAPYVTGITALMLCRTPSLTAGELRDELLSHALKIEGAPNSCGLARIVLTATGERNRSRPIKAATSRPSHSSRRRRQS